MNINYLMDFKECNFEPAEYAANECLANISQFIGPSILQARVENYNPK